MDTDRKAFESRVVAAVGGTSPGESDATRAPTEV